MSFPFHPHQGLIVLDVEVSGPAGNLVVRLALDTGATDTVISLATLVAVGYDPALAANRVRVMTGSRIELVPLLAVDKVAALGHERLIFPVLGHTLPPSATVDGVLGLDFLRGTVLTLDFQQGQITLR